MIERIQIGPTLYRVVEDDIVADAGRCWGRIDYPRQVIHLDARQEATHRRITILHEILHGCFHVTGSQHENEEKIVQDLSATLLDTLRRNSDLMTYLMGDD
jgi:Zn-dependent peptidase ImmA (M78 family)